jgi:carbon-monoxide dehydrogenase medium subunit
VKPAAFDYAAPETLDEALGVLAEHGDEAKVLAGGQSLVPLLALRLARFEQLVDVNRIDGLDGVRSDATRLTLGATTRQATIAEDPLVRRHAPLLADATRYIGHHQIRNRGTIGGSLAHADPAAEYPAIALALDAELEVASTQGRRTIAAADVVESAYVTSLRPDEMIVAVHVPAAPAASGYAIEEVARRHGDFALAGVAVAVHLAADAQVQQARVVVFGLSERAIRLTVVEERLLGADATRPQIDDAIAEAVAELDPPDDVQATSAYRRAVARPLIDVAIRRALSDALAALPT